MTGSRSTSRASPGTPDPDLCRARRRGRPGGQRADRARGVRRRPRGDLPADDPRGRHLDARLRPDRRRALRGLRRVLRRGAALAHRRRPGRPRDHLRRRLPAGCGLAAQAGRGRGGREHPQRAQRARRPPHGRRRGVGRGPRPLVARPRGAPVGHARGAGVRRRAPAVHPLHVRDHREAEGDPAHDRGLPDPGRVHAPQRLRPQGRHRRVLVHRGRGVGHRPLLHRLRPPGQRRDPGHLRGHPGHPAPGPLVGDRGQVRRDDPLHRSDGDPHVHEVGRGHPGRARPVEPAPAGLGR